MLADEVQAAARRYDPAVDGDLSGFAAAVRGAERFVFETDTCVAIDRIALGGLGHLVAALRHSRIPFPAVWTEMELANLGDPLGRDMRAARFPRRVGVLFSGLNDGGDRFACTMAAMFGSRRARAVQIDPYGAEVDLQRSSLTPKAQAFLSARSDPDQASWHAMIVPQLSPFMKSWFDIASAEDRSQHCRGRTAIFVLRAALVGLALINSKNIVVQKSVDLSSFNKVRRRADGRELLSYSEVRIGLSRRDRIATASIGTSMADLRQHIVRGHFKVRRGGVYWWRPFLRGSAEAGTVVRRGYVVCGHRTAQVMPCP